MFHFHLKYNVGRNLKPFGISTMSLKDQRQNIKIATLAFPAKSLAYLTLKKQIATIICFFLLTGLKANVLSFTRKRNRLPHIGPKQLR